MSIAGAQEKTALLLKDGQWFKPTGTAATTHILKPQIGQLPNGIDLSNSVENEYLCLKLVEALGVPAAKAEIADFGERRTLIVERFDRRWTRDGRLLRLPQEDSCQALSIPPTKKYQSEGVPGMREIITLLKGSDTPASDIASFLRASIIFWLLGATDGHAKNFSVFLSAGGRFQMTPLYDVLTAQPSLDAGQIQRKQYKLSMPVGNSRHDHIHEILPRHYLQTADKAGVGLSIVETIIDDLKAHASEKVDEVFNKLPAQFPAKLVESLRKGIDDRVARLNLAGADTL